MYICIYISWLSMLNKCFICSRCEFSALSKLHIYEGLRVYFCACWGPYIFILPYVYMTCLSGCVGHPAIQFSHRSGFHASDVCGFITFILLSAYRQFATPCI